MEVDANVDGAPVGSLRLHAGLLLLSAQVIAVLWVVVACAGKNDRDPTDAPHAVASPDPAGAKELASNDAGDPTAEEGATAKPEGVPGTPTIANLERVVEAKECEKIDEVPRFLKSMGDPDEWESVSNAVKLPGQRSDHAITEWLALAHEYQQLCGVDVGEGLDADDHVHTAPPIQEAQVETWVKKGRCGVMMGVESLQLWPFGERFAREVKNGDFSSAEVTRALWRETLADYKARCGEKLSRRQEITVDTRITKLDRIIGLDDSILIDLRSKMLAALDKEDTRAILDYSRAITEREIALDSRHADQYEEKLRSIEASVAQIVASQGESKSGQGGESAKPDKSAETARKAANVAKTAKSVAETAESTRRVLKTFGVL